MPPWGCEYWESRRPFGWQEAMIAGFGRQAFWCWVSGVGCLVLGVGLHSSGIEIASSVWLPPVRRITRFAESLCVHIPLAIAALRCAPRAVGRRLGRKIACG